MPLALSSHHIADRPPPLHFARSGHTATTLSDGTILIAGGMDGHASVSQAEIYDPRSGTWTCTGELEHPRQGHGVVALSDGRVLVVGGDRWDAPADGSYSRHKTAETYDPSTGEWSTTGAMTCARLNHTTTALATGEVVAAGGCGASKQSAEMYDPQTGVWSRIADMHEMRSGHAAALLPDGRLLVVGAPWTDETGRKSTEIFDPAAADWVRAAPMLCAHDRVEAVTLHTGHVLVVGSASHDDGCPIAELYDAEADEWSVAASPRHPHASHTLTALADGRVLLLGAGFTPSEIYDPTSNTWHPVGRLHEVRARHTAIALPDGGALVVGGTGIDVYYNSEFVSRTANTLDSVERLDTSNGRWRTGSRIGSQRWLSGVTPLDGHRVLVTGGYGRGGPVSVVDTVDGYGGVQRQSSLRDARADHTATTLADGRILVTGGIGGMGQVLDSAEVYDPISGVWHYVGRMQGARFRHTATLLPDGNVLIVGGGVRYAWSGTSASGCEVFDVTAGEFRRIVLPGCGGEHHTATVLENGDVLVVDNDVHLLEFGLGAWRDMPSAYSRISHSAARMPDGHVLVTGGVVRSRTGNMSLVERAMAFDPVSETWTRVAAPQHARQHHTTTVLRDGRTVVIGGSGLWGGTRMDDSSADTTEIYEPESGSWRLSAPMATRRSAHGAVSLTNGRVVVVGGFNQDHDELLERVEVFDPATLTWTLGEALSPDSR